MKFSVRALKLALFSLAPAAAVSGELALTAERAEAVISPDAPKPVRFAAEEMTDFLSRDFGGEVAAASAPTAGRNGIYFGDGEWTRRAGIDTAGAKSSGHDL